MRVSSAIAKWCEDIETPFVAGIPGNGILEIIDDLSKETDIPFVLTRHEQGASMMAYSYAFQTRKPAVVTGSKAPGATNLAIGVMGAYVESLPMIVITAQVHNRHEGFEAFEEIDLAGFFKDITKWSVQVNNAQRTIEVLNEAYRVAMTGRPGPVHVAIPYNFMNELVEYVPPKLPLVNGTIHPETQILKDVQAELLNAERPLIIAGGGLPFENVEQVRKLARKLDAPIVHSWLRKMVPDDDPYYVGMAGIGGSPAAQRAIAEADVVFILGCRLSQQMTEHYNMKFHKNAKLIHIDIDPGVIGRVYNVHIGLEGDIKELLPPLYDNFETVNIKTCEKRRRWREEMQSIHQQYLQELNGYTRDLEIPQGRYVVEVLRELLPEDTPIVLDSGNYLHWAEQYFPVKKAGLFHYPTSGTMGFGVPGAIGAKYAGHDFVCALVGDGGFAMTMSEIETSVREDKPILVVIINNSTLGHIRIRQETIFDNNIVGVNFGSQQFEHVAKVYNAHGITVKDVDNLRSALSSAIENVKNGQTTIVDVHVSDEMSMDATVKWWPEEN